jgi:1,4-dihydroxy-2-naphthoyl-CoA hydrolase
VIKINLIGVEMSIWKKQFTLDRINAMRKNTLADMLSIDVVEFGDDYMIATMPVNERCHQPMGILHGGASIALAETIGSIASNCSVDDEHYCVGQEINGNHLRPVKDGLVYAKATAIHLGGKTQVWEIRITDQNQKNVCASRITMAVLKRN